MAGRPVHKKRKYSRNGCRECKRRRLKCDEGKPSCWNCRHLNKACVYENKVKFTDSRSFTVANTGLVNIGSTKRAAATSPVVSPASSGSGGSPFVDQTPMMVQNPPLASTSLFAQPMASQMPAVNVQMSMSQPPMQGLPQQPLPQLPSYNFQFPVMSRMVFGAPTVPPARQQEVNDSLFNGASSVISDLNEMIQHFNFDFGQVPDFGPIAPQPAEVSNDRYIKTLTKSLKKDYGEDPRSSHRVSTGVPPMVAEEPPITQSSIAPKSLPPIVNDNKADTKDEKPLQTFEPPLPPVQPGSVKSQAPPTPADDSPSKSPPASTGSTELVYAPPPLSILLSDKEPSSRMDYLSVLNMTIGENDLVALAKYFDWSLHSAHVSYMKVFVTKIQMNFLPFTTCFLGNAYIDCFLSEAKNSPHLLFAMLAIAARYETYQVRMSKSENLQKKLKYHSKFRRYYLSSCLKSLESIMQSKAKTLDNIESLLLTILVLASDYSGTKGSEWRAHLKGAKDLLVKYCKFRPITLQLVIVWLWFYSMETLAVLTAYNGGTIHDFEELKEFLTMVKSGKSNMGLALRKFGYLFGGYYCQERPPISSPNMSKTDPKDRLSSYITVDGKLTRKVFNYNLYVGYNDDVMDVFNDIVVAVECFRQRAQAKPLHFKHVINDAGQMRNEYVVNLMAKISRARSFTIINNKAPFRIPVESAYHPLNRKGYHYNNPTGVNVVMSGYIHNTNPETREDDESLNWYSWFDLSQQLFVDALLLKLLITPHCIYETGLNVKSPLVQDVVVCMLESLECLVQYKQGVDLESLAKYYDRDDDSEDAPSPPPITAADQENTPVASDAFSDIHIRKERELESDTEINFSGKVNFEEYLYYQFDNRLVMVQWPLFMCGICCVEPQQKLVIDCCFNVLMSLGVGSSEIMLSRLKRAWRMEGGAEDDSVPFT